MALDGMYAVQRPMRCLTGTDVMSGPGTSVQRLPS